METVSDPDDFTVCSICLQTFTSPKFLPCLHTFCEHCLQGWIEAQVTQIDGNTRRVVFMCPICRTETLLPDNATGAERAEWASTFPSNHIIISLIDKAMIERQKKSCDPCREMKKDVSAIQWCVQCSEAYCDPCTQVHRAMKATRKHKLIGLEDVLRDLKCLSSNEMCNEHADEVIKLYCVDHDQPCCTICGAASHRKCDTVLELSEAAKDVSNTKRFRDLFDNLNQSEKDIGNAAKSLEENLSQLNREKLNIERSAKELKDALMNQIIALHNRFLKQLSDAYTCAVVEISADTEKCYLQQKVVKNSRQILEKSRDHSADTELFLQMKRTEKKCKDSKAFIENRMSKMKRRQLKHSFPEDIKAFRNASSFGNVHVLNERKKKSNEDWSFFPSPRYSRDYAHCHSPNSSHERNSRSVEAQSRPQSPLSGRETRSRSRSRGRE